MVTPETSLEEVLRLLVERRLHRVYVHNVSENAYSIITLTDILRPLVPTPIITACEGPAGGLPASEAEEAVLDPIQMPISAM